MATHYMLELAKRQLDYQNCFWASDAMMHGDAEANKRVEAAEDNLRYVAGRIIGSSMEKQNTAVRSVCLAEWENGKYNDFEWELRGYSEFVGEVPRFAEIVQRQY
jgi:hypothetical protein